MAERDIVRQTKALIGQELSESVREGRRYADQFQRGIGSFSARLARVRGLFNTPGYRIAGMGTPKDPYCIIETYVSGSGASFGALARNRRIGGFINRLTGGLVGGVPPLEKIPTIRSRPASLNI